MSSQSAILAGQVFPDCQQVSETSDSTFAESFYSISPLDQNLDVLADDVFMDSKVSNESDNSNGDDSTKYLPLQPLSNFQQKKPSSYFGDKSTDLNELEESIQMTNSQPDNLSPAAKTSQDNERLLTIIEETEVTYTTNSIRNPSPVDEDGNTGILAREILNKPKKNDKISNSNKNSFKKVLFRNEANIITENQDCRTDKPNLRRKEKSNPLVSKNGCCSRSAKDINENCHYLNTTESFIVLEKHCQSSERLTVRRSQSFSELHSITGSYGGDDEYSTSFKTFEDTYLSNCLIDTVNDTKLSRKKCFKHRSKSFESLLKEVKHLPHLLYDRFLNCLSKEIDHIRKQNVVCTCTRSHKKQSNKENNGRTLKHTMVPSIKISKEDNKKSKYPFVKSYLVN